MSRTVRNEEKYAKKNRKEKSKLSKKYLSFKQGVIKAVELSMWSEPVAEVVALAKGEVQILLNPKEVA